jgi:hypothetical protein
MRSWLSWSREFSLPPLSQMLHEFWVVISCRPFSKADLDADGDRDGSVQNDNNC